VRTIPRLLVVLAALTAVGYATVPRYDLVVGSRLHYSSSSESKYAHGARGQLRSTEVWVVGQSPDRTWRLVLKRSSTSYRVDSAGNRTDGEPQVEWTRCDLAADGNATGISSTGALDPSQLFPPLPADSDGVNQVWERFDAQKTERTRYRVEPGTSDSIRLIRADYETPLDSVYLISSHAVFYLDTKRGLVTRKEAEAEQTWGPLAGKTEAVTTLDSVTRLDTVAARRFDLELAVFTVADSAYGALLDRASEDMARRHVLLDSARTVMDSGLARVSDSTVKVLFDDEVGLFEAVSLQNDRDAAWRGSLIGKPAPAWNFAGLDGRKHSLKDYRGKVAVLDFWYRGCPWCIRAMPQLNSLAQEYRDRPVAVVGMNIDRDTVDARFVVDKLHLGYTNVLARDEYKKYGVQGFPTVYVLDRRGIIRDILVGYSPDVGSKLRTAIDRLLAGK
jgi:thiol-disulfide isomerase/thioredoxin